MFLWLNGVECIMFWDTAMERIVLVHRWCVLRVDNWLKIQVCTAEIIIRNNYLKIEENDD